MEYFIAADPWPNPPLWLVTSAIVAIGYWIYHYLTVVVRRPLLVVPSTGRFGRSLRRNLPLLKQKFYPTIWCSEGRAQTLLARLMRTFLTPDVRYRREIFLLKDGGQVALDWHDAAERDKRAPVMVILPGLLGDSQAEYVKCLVTAAGSIRMRTVVFNNRGLAGIPLKTPRLYCASSYEDLSEVLNHVKEVEPRARICATGISMGGLILGNYLVNRGDESRMILTAAFGVSVPWNMKKGADSIEKPILNQMLGRHLTASLCRLVGKNAILRSEKFDWNMEEVLKSRSIREFDAKFTVKSFGYPSVDSYYAQATLHDKLNRMQVPLLCLSAADDPFQPLRAIPIAAAVRSSFVAIVVTRHGGHIGFLEGWWPFTREQYMCRLFKQYFSAVLFEENFVNFSE